MLLSKLIKNIEKELPAETALEFDKVGLQLQSGRTEINKIIIALEATEELSEEAAAKGADCVIVFHPLIFRPLTKIVEDDRVGKLCSSFIKNSISLITIHTNFDAFPEGTSKILSDALGLKKIEVLSKDSKYEGRGIGLISLTQTPTSLEELVEKTHEICNGSLRYTLGKTDSINKVAIVGGSGSSYINDALEAGADALITADITYHNYHAAKGKMALIDPGHYEMEQFVPKGLKSLIDEIIDEDTETELSETLSNPVYYYPNMQYREKQKLILSQNKVL